MLSDSPVIVLKRRFDAEESLTEMVRAMRAQLTEGRSPERSYTDNELDLVLKLKGLPLRALLALERVGDAFGVLPRSYIDNDPLFASAFVANLGSLGLDAAYHHLYEVRDHLHVLHDGARAMKMGSRSSRSSPRTTSA